jgi:hypothetical protein
MLVASARTKSPIGAVSLLVWPQRPPEPETGLARHQVMPEAKFDAIFFVDAKFDAVSLVFSHLSPVLTLLVTFFGHLPRHITSRVSLTRDVV